MLEDILQRGGGECLDGREGFHEAPEVGNDGGDLRLLEHDFGNPYGIRFTRFPAPWHDAGIRCKPGQEGFAFRGAAGLYGLGRDAEGEGGGLGFRWGLAHGGFQNLVRIDVAGCRGNDNVNCRGLAILLFLAYTEG